jgi:hypothetical protein
MHISAGRAPASKQSRIAEEKQLGAEPGLEPGWPCGRGILSPRVYRKMLIDKEHILE